MTPKKTRWSWKSICPDALPIALPLEVLGLPEETPLPESDSVFLRDYSSEDRMVHGKAAFMDSQEVRKAGGHVLRPITALLSIAILAAAAMPFRAYADKREEAAKLLARTMNNPEFRPKSFRGGEWHGNGDSYLALEPSAPGAATSDIVRYQTATGARRLQDLSGRAPHPALHQLEDCVAPKYAR